VIRYISCNHAANLTPDYLEAEAKFKQAKTTDEKIRALEIMMALIPKHKGTEKIRAQLKSRMAKLKEDLQRKPTVGKAGTGLLHQERRPPRSSWSGLPILANRLFFSNRPMLFSEVADYPFTTQKPILE